ncbi:hypothetical protein EIP86_010955 [Pleurotus ostreatoroseus]|nr:hypothetical protein EIP86_010955 [Pleurotus ostreatoroseus]
MPRVLYLGYYSHEYSLIVPRSSGQDAYEIRICRKEKGRPEACRSIGRPCPDDVNARAVIKFRKDVDAEAASEVFHAAATSAVAERQLGDSLDRLMRRAFSDSDDNRAVREWTSLCPTLERVGPYATL